MMHRAVAAGHEKRRMCCANATNTDSVKAPAEGQDDRRGSTLSK